MKAPDNPLVASCGLEEATQGACHGGAAVGGAGELEQRGALSRGTSFVYAYRKLLCPSGTRERMQKQAMAMQQQGGGVDSGRAHQASAQAGAAPGGGAVPAEAGNPTPAGVPLAPYVAAAEQGGMMGLSVAAAAVSGAPLPVPVSSLATGGFDVLGDAQLPGSQAVNLLGKPVTTTPHQQEAAMFSTMLPAERWSAHVLSAARQPHLGLSLRKSGSFMDLLELSMSHDKPGGSGAAATTGAVLAQRKKRRRGGLGASTRSGSRGGDDGPTQSTDGSCAADTRRTVSEVHLPVGARKRLRGDLKAAQAA
jgi:hypothetical protein